MRGELFTVGYADPIGAARLEQLMSLPQTKLVDIRYSPRSRWRPEWNKKALLEKYGQHYTHLKALGNINYNKSSEPIQLADPAASIVECAQWLLQGWSLILLCACKNYEQCHRKVVYELLQAEIEKQEVQK
jgi:uncharacterized protein (DUF488 family)